MLGGCSSHNAGVLLAGAPADYDEWGEGWSHAVIEPYLRRVEQTFGMRTLSGDELSPWHHAWVETAGEDAIVHPVNLRGWTRWNAAFAYLDPARGRENLTIVADALADRVLLDDERAVGVATSRGELQARTVVLAVAPTARRACCCGAASGRCAACPSARGSSITSAPGWRGSRASVAAR